MTGPNIFDPTGYLSSILRMGGFVYRFLPETQIRMPVPMAYTRAGRKAKVYKVKRDNQLCAMKVFDAGYAHESLAIIVQALRQFSNLPGLTVCRREIVPRSDATSTGEPGLSWSVVMPWVDGDPWISYVEERIALPRPTCIRLASETVKVLVGLESHGLAHADISCMNVLVVGEISKPRVELIDVEDMYHATFIDVAGVPDGTPGYALPANIGKGCRNPFGDRFASAMILTEMLTWHDDKVRRLAGPESLFEQDEIGTSSVKQQHVERVLRSMSVSILDLFRRAWSARSLQACPSLSEWSHAISGVYSDVRFVPIETSVQHGISAIIERVSASEASKARASAIRPFTLEISQCPECKFLVSGSSASGHRAGCPRHPEKLLLASLFPVASPDKTDFSKLLANYREQRCIWCGQSSGIHAPGCSVVRNPPAPSSQPRLSKRALPHHSDVKFVPLQAMESPSPTPPSSGPVNIDSILKGLSLTRAKPVPKTCSECSRLITMEGNVEKGHKFLCSMGAIGRYL